MKRLAILLVMGAFLLGGCATTAKVARNVCPPEDVMYRTINRGTGETGNNFMEKGFFGDEKRGPHWLSVEEYEEMMRRRLGY